MAAGLVGELAEKLNAGRNLKARVCVVSNRFFGSTVTTAGLLTGQDVAEALRAGPAADVVFVPASAVREGEGFLDGMMVESLAAEIGVPVLAAELPREVGAALSALGQRKA
jgi:NifB/MoaA-like Fe-S oxidoreductase